MTAHTDAGAEAPPAERATTVKQTAPAETAQRATYVRAEPLTVAFAAVSLSFSLPPSPLPSSSTNSNAHSGCVVVLGSAAATLHSITTSAVSASRAPPSNTSRTDVFATAIVSDPPTCPATASWPISGGVKST
eukprot:scaffold52888_cov70-Phaeocystis_antarctica.AAC.7